MAFNTDVTLGYGGGAKLTFINGLPFVESPMAGVEIDLPITGGNFSNTFVKPSFSFYDVPQDVSSRSSVVTGYGTQLYSGSLTFDLTEDIVANMITENFFKRYCCFNIDLHDGNKAYNIKKCYLTSFSFSLSPRSIVSCSLSYVSNNDLSDDISSTFIPKFLNDDSFKLIKYWNVGNTGVESLTFNFNLDVSPERLNTFPVSVAGKIAVSNVLPTYFRCGNISISLSLSSWDDWIYYKSFRVGIKTITFKELATTEMSFTHNGQNDTGTHSWSGDAVNLTNASDELFTIT